MKIGKYYKQNRYVVTETIFTCEEVKELSREDILRLFAFFNTVLMRFTEDLLMSNCPRNACDWQWQYQQPE